MHPLWFDWSIKKSIDYPRLHHQIFPTNVMLDPDFPRVCLCSVKIRYFRKQKKKNHFYDNIVAMETSQDSFECFLVSGNSSLHIMKRCPCNIQ